MTFLHLYVRARQAKMATRPALRHRAAAISFFIIQIWPEAIDLRQCRFCPFTRKANPAKP
jgi:hypothetical protein